MHFVPVSFHSTLNEFKSNGVTHMNDLTLVYCERFTTRLRLFAAVYSLHYIYGIVLFCRHSWNFLQQHFRGSALPCVIFPYISFYLAVCFVTNMRLLFPWSWTPRHHLPMPPALVGPQKDELLPFRHWVSPIVTRTSRPKRLFSTLITIVVPLFPLSPLLL
jgi:hypothetical protein